MSIASELSCDVAIAILSRGGEKNPAGDGTLTSVVLEVHSTLRKLTEEARRLRRAQLLSVSAAQVASAGGAGGN